LIDFVIDASAILELIAGPAPDQRLRRRALTGHGAAPELIDLEAASVIRRTVLAGEVDPDVGRERLQEIKNTPISRTAHRPLLSRIWELRDAITAYDATYVALAEQLDVPLLTCAAKLGRSNGHRAEIVVYPRS
jgi:predicted nucleic acid-binding protein